jgi:hypothetical protein
MQKSLLLAVIGCGLLGTGLYFSRPDPAHAQTATARYIPLGVATGSNGLHSIAWYIDVNANKVVMCSSTNPPSCYATQVP